MNNNLIALLTLVPALNMWAATTETTKPVEKKLPEIVTKTRIDNDTKNFKNYQMFKTNWIKNETERLKILNEALKSSTQKGDFDTCLVIKDEITGVESLITMLNDPQCKMVSYEFMDNKEGEKKTIYNDKALIDILSGSWQGGDFNIIIKSDKKLSLNINNYISDVCLIHNKNVYIKWKSRETIIIKDIQPENKKFTIYHYFTVLDNVDEIDNTIIEQNIKPTWVVVCQKVK